MTFRGHYPVPPLQGKVDAAAFHDIDRGSFAIAGIDKDILYRDVDCIDRLNDIDHRRHRCIGIALCDNAAAKVLFKIVSLHIIVRENKNIAIRKVQNDRFLLRWRYFFAIK